MFSHVMVGSNDTERSRGFYDGLFASMGGKPGRMDDKGRCAWMHNGGVFMVSRPIDGEEACVGNGSTIGFALPSPEAVVEWQKAGVAAGGTAIEDPPGIRSNAFGSLYLAYLRDPDGNKLCGLYRVPPE